MPLTLDEIDAYLDLAHALPTTRRGPAWYAHVDALLEQRTLADSNA